MAKSTRRKAGKKPAKTGVSARTPTEAQLQKWSAPYRDLDRDFWAFRMTDVVDKTTVADGIRASGLSISDFLREAAIDFAKRCIAKRGVAR